MLLRPLLAKCLTNTHHGRAQQILQVLAALEGTLITPLQLIREVYQQGLFDQPLLELCIVDVNLHQILVCCGGGNDFFLAADVFSLFF